MSRINLVPWIDVLKAVDSVRTPIGLAALTALVLFYLYRMIFSRLPLGGVHQKDVAKIVSKAMTLLFWLAVTAIVIAMLSYVLLRVFDTTEADVSQNIRDLRPGNAGPAFAAVQALSRVAERTEDYDETLCDSLSAFVRENRKPSEPVFVAELATEVQAAVVLLSKLNETSRCGQLDLHGANLARLNLARGRLSGADLSGATLDEANLVHADLTKSDMTATSLVEANLQHASVKQANLTSADLSGADLRCAHLDGAKGLDENSLSSTLLDGASLRSLNLHWTHGSPSTNYSACSD